MIIQAAGLCCFFDSRIYFWHQRRTPQILGVELNVKHQQEAKNRGLVADIVDLDER